MKTRFLCGLLLSSVSPCLASNAPHAFWKLPHGAYFQALSRRPDGKIAVYWESNTVVNGHHTFPLRRVLLDQKSGRVFDESLLPDANVAPGIDIETFNARGQHAFLAGPDARKSQFLQLKSGGKYRTLQNLPRFPDGSLQDLKFSPDGEVLKVLGRQRLWIIGAQSGKLLQIIKPSRGKWWSWENAVLSPDGSTVLAMREKMWLFSARTGKLIKRFGIHLETLTGGCGELVARVGFSPDGSRAIANQDDDATYEFPSRGGKNLWRGVMPYNARYSRDGRFYFDFKNSRDERTKYPVVKSALSHHVLASFPTIRFEDIFATPIEFSDDARTVFWVQNGVLRHSSLKIKGL